MRYYKRGRQWPHAYLRALLGGGLCLALAIVTDDPEGQVTGLACAVAGLAAAWLLWQAPSHYLEIGGEAITHRGLTRWRVPSRTIERIERGREGWVDEYEPYLRIIAGGRVYRIDGGFLANAQQADELARTLQALAQGWRR